MKICHAGSTLGEKANTAIATCSATAEERAKKGKGKSPKCPTVNKIMDMVAEEYAGEICVFTEMGWLDENMNSDDNLIEEDIASLPTEISEALNSEGYDTCVQMAEEKMANLGELVNGIAHTECFMKIFKESCGSYVKNTI